jgi:8-oxo-dGTP diphosphatase
MAGSRFTRLPWSRRHRPCAATPGWVTLRLAHRTRQRTPSAHDFLSTNPAGGRSRAARRGAAGFAPLKTERLILRPLVAADAPALHRLINDWEVTRTLAVVPFPYPRELADEWIALAAEQIAAGTAYHLAVTGKEGEQELLVGGVGLRIAEDRRSGTLGYWVGRRFWGHGVAGEAAGRLARWALANLDLELLVASVAIDNPASAAVLRRIGFRQVGAGEQMFAARGGKQKVLHFEATRADLFAAPAAAPAAPPAAPPAAAPAAPPTERPGDKPLLLVAAVALIDADGRVLLARRPEGKPMAGLWEFPGGKLRAGETPEAALIRELREELGIDVAAACLAPFAFASHAYDRFHLLMPLYLCRRWKGRPKPREGQTLSWVRPERLADYPMPEADRPLVPLLRDFL